MTILLNFVIPVNSENVKLVGEDLRDVIDNHLLNKMHLAIFGSGKNLSLWLFWVNQLIKNMSQNKLAPQSLRTSNFLTDIVSQIKSENQALNLTFSRPSSF